MSDVVDVQYECKWVGRRPVTRLSMIHTSVAQDNDRHPVDHSRTRDNEENRRTIVTDTVVSSASKSDTDGKTRSQRNDTE